MELPNECSKAILSPITLGYANEQDIGAFLCPLTLEIMKDPVITSDGNDNRRKSFLNILELYFIMQESHTNVLRLKSGYAEDMYLL